MAGRVIYLDIDDEITSAASRIRSTEGSRVAVVLPHGSRVATSRINFRLLARDAMTSGKRLSIVAADPATRALAASAGLPIFATVAEYESSLEDGRADEVTPTAAGGSAGDEDEPILNSETVATPAPKRPRTDAAAGTGDAAAAAGAAAGLEAAAAATGASAPGVARPTPATVPFSGESRRPVRTPASIPAARVVADTPGDQPDRLGPSHPEPARPGLRPSLGRTPLVIGLAVLALALVVGGAGAYLFLPTATATIRPREASIGPVSLRIVASTTATAPDPAKLVVPAREITIPLEASDTFPSTGKRVEEKNAHGRVTFQSFNPVSSNTIPRGSIVSTEGGIRFRTDKTVTLSAADLIFGTPVQVKPSSASVDVTAVDAGTDGNVPANAIKVVPSGEDPDLTHVRNPDPTTGGKHTEFKRIRQEDVDKATVALTAKLAAAFDERLADPNLPGDAATLFPETKTLAAPVFGVDPATLVGKEVETFELSATASGTVVAVDTDPVQTVAEARISSSVDPGYALIDGSGQVVPAPAEISGGVITFPVVVTARQVLVLDPAAIEGQIMGKPLDEARAILDTYGEAQLTVWPDWVGTVPTIDSRVDVTTTSDGAP